MNTRRQHTMVQALFAFTASVSLSAGVLAQIDQKDLEAAASQFSDKKYVEAAAAYEKLTAALGADQARLKPTLAFNRGCAQLAAGDTTAAEKTFIEVDASTADLSLRAAARYNLAQIACKQAEPMVEKDKAAAIETYRRAERHFRNALDDQPGHADAARNIEVVQRKIAKLLDEQKKQEQQRDPKDQQNKQDQKDQDKNNPDQQNKDQQKQDQDKKDQQKSEQQKQDQQKKDQQQQGQSGQDQKDQQNQQQQGKDGKKDEKPSKPEEQKDKKPEEGKDGKDQKDQQQQDQQAADQQQQAGKPQDHREFDLTAAQILDKEKKQRERLKQLLQLMRARAAPVEKDW